MNKNKKEMSKSFEDLSISTQTVIAYLNCTFNIDNLFEELPVKDITENKTDETMIKEINGEHGKIYQLKNADRNRGVLSTKGHFRNQINMYIYIIDKMVTIKILPTGKFHLTGCKTPNHTHQAAIILARLINKVNTPEKPTIIMENDEPLNIILETVMVNIDFKLDFDIDLKKLDKAMQNPDTPFWSIYDPPVNTSVNVKLPFELPEEIRHDHIIFDKGINKSPKLTFTNKCPKATKMPKKEHTFLVFSSSKVIQSGRNYNSEMKPVHDKFIQFIKEHRSEIELKLSDSPFNIHNLIAINKFT